MTVELENLVGTAWRLDPDRSSVEFHVRNFWGLMTVKGRFERFEGTLSKEGTPAVSLVIHADSIDTGNKKRDEHLQSADFFDAGEHPYVRFEAAELETDGQALKVSGVLHAAGRQVPVESEATLTPIGGEIEIEATATVDHRDLGMTWSPMGMLRAPTKLFVRGRLTRAGGDPAGPEGVEAG